MLGKSEDQRKTTYGIYRQSFLRLFVLHDFVVRFSCIFSFRCMKQINSDRHTLYVVTAVFATNTVHVCYVQWISTSSLKVIWQRSQDGPKFDVPFTDQLCESLRQQSPADRSVDGRPKSPWCSSRLAPHGTHVAAFQHRSEGELP